MEGGFLTVAVLIPDGEAFLHAPAVDVLVERVELPRIDRGQACGARGGADELEPPFFEREKACPEAWSRA